LLDLGAVGLDLQVRRLKPGRPQAPSAPADRGLGAADASGELEQPPAAILGVERVGQAHGDVLTRHPAAKHGGSLLLADDPDPAGFQELACLEP
ncbi:MAG: hypothetical protein OXG35_26030, partial [Acidobacteria bacterium]|nr:hypothetical protein [Acidobacteriota bacterium]